MKRPATKLLDLLRTYDGRAISILGEIEAEFGAGDDYLDKLITFAAHEQVEVSDGATWLIKSALENGARFSAGQTAALCQTVSDTTTWQAQLHVCQSVQYLDLSQTDAAVMAEWLKPLLTHDRPFLRAWSLDALCRIGVVHEEYAEAAREALATADEDNAASVRARARKLAGLVG
ncbi:MAG: hypothetical protein AAF067_08845 [Pseudomonadota bacterium]